MSALLADIDATCAALGYNDGTTYHPEPDSLHGLKHLIWILRRDSEVHEYRRYVGRGKVLQTDLLPMIMHHTSEDELSDVLLRLLVNLTNPALLLYREELPKDGPGRRNYLELIEILQGYKQAFSLQPVWASLGKRLQTSLEVVSTNFTQSGFYDILHLDFSLLDFTSLT